MAFGSFFTRALDIITPWMRGGEVQRRNERKKREDEERQAQRNAYNGQSAPSQGNFNQTGQNAPNQEQQLKPQQPVNIFEGLNKDLVFNKPQTVVPVVNTQNNQPVQPPKPGDIVKPKQNLLDKMRDQFDANTEADQYRRQEGNRLKGEDKPIILDKPGNIISKTPVVGFAAKAFNTLANQDRELRETIRGVIASRTNNSEAFRASQQRQDDLRENYMKNKGGLFNVGTLYDEEGAARGDIKTGAKDIAAPGAVSVLDAYTLGKGNLISDAIKEAGLRSGLRTSVPNIVKATLGNYGSGDLGVRAEGGTNEQAVKSGLINSFLSLAPDILLPAIGKSIRNRILPKVFNGRPVNPGDVVEEIDDAAISASAESAIQATKPRPIPVKKNIPVNEVVGDNLDIPVQVTTPPKPKGPIIRELEGDAKVATQDSVVARKVADIRQAEADVVNNVPTDRRIEGVTPRAPEKPFVLNEDRVVIGQDKVVDDYAGFLQEVGEKNGTQLVPDGEGGFTRTTNNVRFGDTGGKRMTKAMWRDEAERQLREGTAEPSLQKAYNESADPEIQALLERGERPDVPVGNPITVKQVNGINVVDNTDVPTNLPEVPGTVRVTESTAPSNTKSAAVAAQSPSPILPKETQAILDNPKQVVKPEATETKASAKVQEDATKQLDNVTGEADSISPARRDLIYSLGEANKQSVRDARALSVARGERAGKASGMADGLEGEAATRARRAGFKGELGHRGRYVGIGGDQGEKIFNDLRLEAQRNPELSKRIYTLDGVEEALSRAIRGTDLKGNTVGAPTKGQIELLRQYFGEDVGKAVEDAVNTSKGLKDKILEGAGQVIGAPRSIMASLDFSATLRQGGVLGSRFPKEAASAAKEQLKYFASSESFKKGMEEIASRSSYDTMIKSGLDITGTRGLDKAEEQFISTLAEKIPGFGRGVAASDRAYTGFLTKLRADVFDKVVNKSLDAGVELSQRELDDLAKFVNTASGRGNLGSLEDHAKTLSTTLFSPRLWKSRLDMLNPAYYAKLSGPAQKLALQSAASYAAIASSVLGLAAVAGANVETDLRSSDFGKIKRGNNRYDVLGGFQQNLVFAWREITGEKKSSTTGEVTKFARGVPDLIKGRSDEEAGVQTGPYTPNRVSVASDLVGNKANPVIGAAGRILSGKDRGGNPVNPLEELARMSVPLSLSGAWDAANDIGDAKNPIDFAKGMLINSPDTIGISSQTYGETPTKDQNFDKYAEAKDRATSLRDQGAITDSSKIQDAIDNGDYDLALKSYEYQKAQAEASSKSTEKDIARIDANIKEATYLKQGVPKTDDGIEAKMENSDWDSAVNGYRWKIERGEADGEMSKKTKQDIEKDIKRVEIYKDNKIPYEMVQTYKGTTLTEWRAMEEDDPDTYQKLWDIDKAMADKKVSYKYGDPEKQKYYAKTSGKGGRGGRGGRGGSGARNIDTSFGTLKTPGFAPKVQEYASIGAQSGQIPHISVKRPNIVHKITSSG